jgi:DNA-binding response OmpR family regulator
MPSEATAHILLVDDDPVQVQVREAILHDAGFAVSIATSAEAALALLRSEHPQGKIDAVITDHILPGASGAEFVRSMRGIAPQLPVIVLTGMLTAQDEYGGSDVIFRAKPLAPADLIAILRAEIVRAR